MKIRRDLGIESELKVSVDASLERLKFIYCWEDGQGREFLSLEVMGTNERAHLYSELIRLISATYDLLQVIFPRHQERSINCFAY